jgi:hypothetical protein
MAVKSILTIQVDDADFKRFIKSFNQYTANLGGTSGQWRQAGQAAQATAAAAQKMNVAFNVHMNNQIHLARVQSQALRQTAQQANLWSNMAKSAHQFSQHIFSATRQLLRWADISGIISGVLGVGGLFGIERLSESALAQRKNAMGLGSTTSGGSRSFDINYGKRLLDSASGFLQNINSIMKNPAKMGQFAAVGMSGEDFRGRKVPDVGVTYLERVKRIVDSVPDEMLETISSAYGIDQNLSLEDIVRLKRSTPEEMARYRQDYAKDTKDLGLTREQLRAWSDLEVQFDRASTMIKNTFIVALTPLAPQIESLSKSFSELIKAFLTNDKVVEWINHFAEGMHQFADNIAKPEFAKNIEDFVNDIEKLAKGVAKGVKWLTSWFDDKETKSGPEIYDPGGMSYETPGSIADRNALALGTWIRSIGGGSSSSPSGVPPGIQFENAVKDAGERLSAPPTKFPNDYGWLRDWWYRQHGTYDRSKLLLDDRPGWMLTPRGIRNNNPLNLGYVPGQEGVIGSDGRFGVYGSMENGIAAAERQLLLYQERGLDTISKMVTSWAPEGENDTKKYIEQVAKNSGFGPNDKVNMRDPRVAEAIISAMAQHETGRTIGADSIHTGVAQGMASRSSVDINIYNATGGSAVVQAAQLR